MINILPFIQITLFITCAVFLIFKPKPFLKFIGNIYWHMGKFTALGKSDNTKKYFIGENTFWFRALGVILLVSGIASLLANIEALINQ